MAGESTAEQKIDFHFSPSSQALIDRLSAGVKQTNVDTDQFVREVGEENAIKLVVELVDQGATDGHFFADALTLVRFDSLPQKTRDWFIKEGLLYLDQENIRVHLKHAADLRAFGCHEVGYLIDGIPTVTDIDTTIPPTHVTANTFTTYEKSKEFPRGALAEVVIWNRKNPRLLFTVAGGYVCGGGPNARGILVPAGPGQFPIVYLHTINSFENGRDERNFYIKRGVMHPNAWYGLEALGMYLRGEIPAKGEIAKESVVGKDSASQAAAEPAKPESQL